MYVNAEPPGKRIKFPRPRAQSGPLERADRTEEEGIGRE